METKQSTSEKLEPKDLLKILNAVKKEDFTVRLTDEL